ncbi:hypothetical protein JVU11DRAFT_894 [Chiua virens]|nr:hypothetical protein JVU11DRAFT_894 [Chiua virens]
MNNFTNLSVLLDYESDESTADDGAAQAEASIRRTSGTDLVIVREMTSAYRSEYEINETEQYSMQTVELDHSDFDELASLSSPENPVPISDVEVLREGEDNDSRPSCFDSTRAKELIKARPTPWFSAVIRYVQRVPLIDGVQTVVKRWVEIQEKLGFPDPDGRAEEYKLTLKYRPEYFSTWMRNHRPLSHKVLPIFDSAQFFREFRYWWSSIQPSWRVQIDSEPFTRHSPSTADWSRICRAGSNGMILIVVAIIWLSLYISPSHSKHARLMQYVEDVAWVFEQVSEWISSGGGKNQRWADEKRKAKHGKRRIE